ncbi:hypothetical protein TrCOL_g6597 [Triparma columacea]|uniref:folate gamma-glutamyl hydrolase n=1 Tax=Triparma columacea TaxID=722753 RepID=A0A9W7GPN1_9STRA|nr:hypothetical protein TrCOL_g6597 [Triparma columacea]
MPVRSFKLLVVSLWLLRSALSQSESAQLYGQPAIGILTFPVTEQVWEGSRSIDKVVRDLRGTSLPPRSLTAYAASNSWSSSDSLPSYFDASYVNWLSQAGARVVPIPFDLPLADLEDLFPKLNGVLFTGGPAQPETDKEYFNTATALYNLVSTSETHVPLWGTCLGFETISSIVGSGENNVLSEFDAEKLSLPLTFTPEADVSQVYSAANMPPPIREIFSSQNVTTHWHMYGVSSSAFASNLAPAGLVATSTNFDREGKEFVSSLEHSSLPIFATQWHPEANQFDSTDKKGDSTPSRSSDAVLAMQHLANFFVGEARKNDNKFDDEDDFSIHVLNATSPNTTFDGWIYFFR